MGGRASVPAAAGKRCLQINQKNGQKSAAGIFHRVKPSETVYIRYYRMRRLILEWLISERRHASPQVRHSFPADRIDCPQVGYIN